MNKTIIFNSIKKWYCHKPSNGKQIWLIAIGALACLLIQIILLNLLIVTVSMETLEPYYVTETSYQPYALTENVVTETSVQKNMTIAEGYYIVVPYGVIVPFQIDRPSSHLTGTFENSISGSFLIYDSANHIIWEKLGSQGNIDLNLPPGNYRAKFQENLMWGEDVYIYLALGWNEIEHVITAQKISGSDGVPIIISKEKMVLKEVKCSIWELITNYSISALKRS